MIYQTAFSKQLYIKLITLNKTMPEDIKKLSANNTNKIAVGAQNKALNKFSFSIPASLLT